MLSPFGPAEQLHGGSSDISASSFWMRFALLLLCDPPGGIVTVFHNLRSDLFCPLHWFARSCKVICARLAPGRDAAPAASRANGFYLLRELYFPASS